MTAIDQDARSRRAPIAFVQIGAAVAAAIAHLQYDTVLISLPVGIAALLVLWGAVNLFAEKNRRVTGEDLCTLPWLWWY